MISRYSSLYMILFTTITHYPLYYIFIMITYDYIWLIVHYIIPHVESSVCLPVEVRQQSLKNLWWTIPWWRWTNQPAINRAVTRSIVSNIIKAPTLEMSPMSLVSEHGLEEFQRCAVHATLGVTCTAVHKIDPCSPRQQGSKQKKLHDRHSSQGNHSINFVLSVLASFLANRSWWGPSESIVSITNHHYKVGLNGYKLVNKPFKYSCIY